MYNKNSNCLNFSLCSHKEWRWEVWAHHGPWCGDFSDEPCLGVSFHCMISQSALPVMEISSWMMFMTLWSTWNGMSNVCLYSLHFPPTCSNDWELKTVRWRPEKRQTSIQLREVSLLLNLILGTQLSDWEWNKTFIQFV